MKNWLKVPDYKYVMFALMYAGWTLSYLDRSLISLALPMLSKELVLDPAQMGTVLGIFYLVFAVMQFPGGWLADTIGSKKIMVGAVMFWSIFTVGTGLAWSYVSLLAVRVFFALGEGSYPSTCTKALAENFDVKVRGRAFSILISAGSAGGIISMLAGAQLIQVMGWRNTYIFFGCTGVILAILLAIIIRPKPKSEAQVDFKMEKEALVSLLKTPLLWLLTAACFTLLITVWGLGAWLPTYLMTVRKIPLTDVGNASAIALTIGLIATIFGGFITDKFFSGKEKWLAIFCGAIAVPSLYFMLNTPDFYIMCIFWLIQTIAINICFVSYMTIPIKHFAPEVMGKVFGVLNTGNMLGGVVAPFVMGHLVKAQNGSYDYAFGFLIASLAVFVTILLFIDSKPSVQGGQKEEV